MPRRFRRAAQARPIASAFAVAAVLLALATTVRAALPTFWQVATEAEFLQGEVENLSVDTYGRLTLGPSSTTVYESTAPFLWTIVTAPDGSIYAGSGNEGQVFRIDPAGQATTFFDAPELEVHAIALAPGGGIYAATSPDGKVYKIEPSGAASVFFDPDDRYIWSLAVDPAGNVYVGTGDRGVIYKVTPAGVGSVFYETKATHAMALAIDREGRLLAGTESPGRVFQIDANGRPFVLLDSTYGEIRTLRVNDAGEIWLAAVSARGGSTAPAPAPPAPETQAQPVATVSTEVTFTVAPDAVVQATPAPQQGGGQARAASTGPGAGAIFRITPQGESDLIWQLRDDTPYDLAFDRDGSVLVATGNDGKIYRLSGDPMLPTLVTRALAQQVTNLQPDANGRILFTTSNPGKVFRLSDGRSDRGTYLSTVRDAMTVATWGTIKWQGAAPPGTTLAISTRSGNTRTPDETWSDWSAPYTDPAGSQITSPRARYLQFRAILTGNGTSAPVLTSVTAAYLPRNTRPRVTQVTVHPPGTVFQRPFPTGEPEIAGFDGDTPERRAAAQLAPPPPSPTQGRRMYERGLLTFAWRAEDDNRDELRYDVEYRLEGETTWKLLKGGLREDILVWDTTSVPNGRYVIRVLASDAPSNSPETALVGMLESTAFDIDNTPPEIRVTGAQRNGDRLVIAFEVRDDHSAVQKAEYSLDGERWQTIYPRDGIADSRLERYELVLEGPQTARGVIIRATDALNNVTSARGEAPAQPAAR